MFVAKKSLPQSRLITFILKICPIRKSTRYSFLCEQHPHLLDLGRTDLREDEPGAELIARQIQMLTWQLQYCCVRVLR